MKNTEINLTDMSNFVITGRNKDNSMFYIRPKSDFERELELIKENTEKDKHPLVTSASEGFESEERIIKMMDEGIKFYTYNVLNETFIEIIEVNENIKSKPNETDIDNINSLPILSLNN